VIADLKPYPEYKESGLPWLGRVPDGWRVVRNGSLFGQRNETGYAELPILEVSLRTGVRVRDFENSTRKQVMADLGKYKRALCGDVSYNMMRMWQGAVGIAPVDGLVSPAYVVARPFPGVDPSYFVSLFRIDDYKAEVDNCSRGIVKDRNRLYWDQFKQILSPCPPPSEQAAIVRFLGWANGRLERAIRAKRKVIALLNEQKQAIIHRAVTRGLDPSVALKPSGIPWLGDIPSHWEVWPLRRCISIRSGDFANPLRLRAELSDSHSIPVVGGNGVMGFTDQINNQGTTIVIGRVGALCGNVHLIDGDAWVTDNALRITRMGGFSAAYLAEQLRTMDLNRLANANAQPLVTGGIIKSQRVTRPPMDEQEAIACYLVELTAPTDTAISRLEREIELLREYRTRLIADVVTGKLDVREAAARLPDEAAPDIAEDESDISDEIESTDEEVAAA
jgi:type I restriction enzyme, S subunit